VCPKEALTSKIKYRGVTVVSLLQWYQNHAHKTYNNKSYITKV